MSPRLVFVAVCFLGAALLLSLALIGFLALKGVESPGVLENVAVGALTGLAVLVRPASAPPSD